MLHCRFISLIMNFFVRNRDRTRNVATGPEYSNGPPDRLDAGNVVPVNAKKALVRMRVWLHSFLTSAIYGGGQLHVPAALSSVPTEQGGLRRTLSWSEYFREEKNPSHAGNRMTVPRLSSA
jgi:hypothetical protein